MRKMFVVLFSLLCVLVGGQTEIEYQNKILKKVLQKEGIIDFSSIKELPVPGSAKKQHYVQGKFFKINSDKSQYKYIYTGRVNSCRAGGCSISVEQPMDAKSEYFDYFILFDSAKTVQLVKVYDYKATHGHEVTAKGWLKQFISYDGSKSLKVDKNIDAISGATISVYAITFDIELKTQILQGITTK
ncbi:MAG: FMN-binding protein [Bacteroidales bacterium]|nr:FMN-binding protein [Bacteroidales bacterium]